MIPDTVRIDHATYRGATGVRDYRVARPVGGRDGLRPVVVVLHGCLQGADDVALGTRFDQRAAAERGWVVAYPEQPASAHPNRCWNWYEPVHQRRDEGEPAVLVGILDEVLTTYHGDPERVFVVGISAGGAMAANLVALYPERFRALGVHSGVPAFGAKSLVTALAAMQAKSAWQPDDGAEAVLTAMGERARAIPVLVLHGDEDTVVSPENADHLVRQFTGVAALLHTDVTVRRKRVPGLGHAWAGGDPAGSFTAPSAVDATADFLAFFDALASRD